MSSTVTLNKFVSFEDFFEKLKQIESDKNSWFQETESEEELEKKYELKRLRIQKKNRLQDQNQNQQQNQQKIREANLCKETDLRRKLLYKLGKYELEEGEVFE